jgi:hypothetical protein
MVFGAQEGVAEARICHRRATRWRARGSSRPEGEVLVLFGAPKEGITGLVGLEGGRPCPSRPVYTPEVQHAPPGIPRTAHLATRRAGRAATSWPLSIAISLPDPPLGSFQGPMSRVERAPGSPRGILNT